MRSKKWDNDLLLNAIENSYSLRQVIIKLGLVPAGGNYEQIKKFIKLLKLNTSHFKGQGWNKGLKGIGHPRIALDKILVKNSNFQSYKLKARLFKNNIKNQKCEICGWFKNTNDGRVPLELDHINGDKHDNRLENIRILCPNCHSLQPTHRGRNIKNKM